MPKRWRVVPGRKKAAKIPSGSLDTVMRGQASDRNPEL